MPTEHNFVPNGMNIKPLKHMGEAKTYTFFDALREVSNGKAITKLEWNTNDIYCQMVEGILCIRLNGQFDRWIISQGDLFGIDWVVMPEQVETIEPENSGVLLCNSCGVEKGEKHKDWCEDDLGEEDEGNG